jgi:hypothetical protein
MVSNLWNLPADETPPKRLKVNQIGKGYMAMWAFPTSGNRDSLHGDVGNPDIASSEIPEITQSGAAWLTQAMEAKPPSHCVGYPPKGSKPRACAACGHSHFAVD